MNGSGHEKACNGLLLHSSHWIPAFVEITGMGWRGCVGSPDEILFMRIWYQWGVRGS